MTETNTPSARARAALRLAAETGGDMVALSVDDVGAILAGHGGQDVERRHPFPGNVLVHVNDMWSGDSTLDGPEQARSEVRTPTENLAAAMVVTSDTGRVSAAPWDTPGPVHRPVLDLDMPVTVWPSSTEGHSHVLIDHPIAWDRYVVLLEALVEAGLLERGYLEASVVRGHTGVRVPWFRKGDLAPNLDGTPQRPPSELGGIRDVCIPCAWGDTCATHNPAAVSA